MLTKNSKVVFGEKLGWISVINHHILIEFSKNHAQSLTFYLIFYKSISFFNAKFKTYHNLDEIDRFPRSTSVGY